MLPLTLLAGLRAFDPATRPRVARGTRLALLGALLQNGNQFVFAALGLALVGVQTWLAAPRAERAGRAARVGLAAAAVGRDLRPAALDDRAA